MAGRFTRLEINEEEGHRSRIDADAQVAGVPVRTPGHDLHLAHESYRRGRFEPALQLYTRALQGDRALIPAWVGQVQMLVELGEYHEARLWSDKALELFKGNGDLLAAKARACLRDRDRPGAIVCSDEAISSPGSSSLRWQSRGEVLLDKRGESARACFEKSLTEPQADWFDRVVIARIYLFHDRAAAAHEFARAATRLEPANGYAWYVVGRAQEGLGWLTEAEASYERSLQLAGEHEDARTALQSLRTQGRCARMGRWFGGLLRR